MASLLLPAAGMWTTAPPVTTVGAWITCCWWACSTVFPPLPAPSSSSDVRKRRFDRRLNVLRRKPIILPPRYSALINQENGTDTGLLKRKASSCFTGFPRRKKAASTGLRRAMQRGQVGIRRPVTSSVPRGVRTRKHERTCQKPREDTPVLSFVWSSFQ